MGNKKFEFFFTNYPSLITEKKINYMKWNKKELWTDIIENIEKINFAKLLTTPHFIVWCEVIVNSYWFVMWKCFTLT
jgi:hypothetical protein